MCEGRGDACGLVASMVVECLLSIRAKEGGAEPQFLGSYGHFKQDGHSTSLHPAPASGLVEKLEVEMLPNMTTRISVFEKHSTYLPYFPDLSASDRPSTVLEPW